MGPSLCWRAGQRRSASRYLHAAVCGAPQFRGLHYLASRAHAGAAETSVLRPQSHRTPSSSLPSPAWPPAVARASAVDAAVTARRAASADPKSVRRAFSAAYRTLRLRRFSAAAASRIPPAAIRGRVRVHARLPLVRRPTCAVHAAIAFSPHPRTAPSAALAR